MRSYAPPLLAALAALLLSEPASSQRTPLPDEIDPDYLATYSIIARDPATGELGIGVQSKAFAAGNRAQHARGGVAVIAHQAAANPMYGTLGVELIQRGYSPQEALDMMVMSDEGRDRRQVAILDAQGRSAAWTGSETNAWAGHRCGVNVCAQGNILSGPQVVDAMLASFESSSGRLEDRLLAALDAAEAAGGDARGKQSGAILVVHPRVNEGFSDVVVDIRVDDARDPHAELRRILDLRRSGQVLAEANQRRAAGDLAGALERATRARDLSPQNDGEWLALARIYTDLERSADAVQALSEAVQLQPRIRGRLADDPDFQRPRQDPAFRRLIGS